MSYQIYPWKSIKNIFTGSNILLGNGASIAVDSSFNYKSLRDVIEHLNMIEDNTKELFGFFETNDFEQILKIVWQANNVNKVLEVKDIKTKKVYEEIRDSLIKAVKEVHPDYKEIYSQLETISNFLREFNIVISLNYDLIIYWSILYGNQQNIEHQFVDCFKYEEFFYDNNKYCFDRTKTKVFYPHGNLILAFDKILNEVKLNAKNDNLIEDITQQWKSEEYVPLFISEGISKQKIDSIRKSNYLNTVFRNVLPKMIKITKWIVYPFNIDIQPSYIIGDNHRRNRCNTLVIYGFGFGEEDTHILDKILSAGNFLGNRITCIAISVYNQDKSYCSYVINKLEKYNKSLHIYFFDSQSSGCWNNT